MRGVGAYGPGRRALIGTAFVDRAEGGTAGTVPSAAGAGTAVALGRPVLSAAGAGTAVALGGPVLSAGTVPRAPPAT